MADSSPAPLHRHKDLQKFFLLLTVLVGYFLYLSWHYDLATSGIVAALTWSFFVLCTPIADAGFLLDFPVRLITGMRMIFTEMLVWTLAITINLSALYGSPAAYDTTFLTRLFHTILTTPWPYWSIIALCAAGTFLSVKLGDDLLDAAAHKQGQHTPAKLKLRFAGLIALMALIVFIYYDVLKTLGIELPE